MGKLYFNTYTNVDSANGVVGSGVTIQVYAWAEDVELSQPTVSLAVQSQDEYGTGPVSSVASAIAKASGSLTKVPVIGKFMTATSIASTAIGKVAHIFGFTNPPVINNVQPYKPGAFQHFASTEISVPSDKLSLDAKNELSIDPSIHGLASDDELSIAHLVTREFFLCRGYLTTTQVPDDEIFIARVLPLLHNKSTETATTFYVTPPMGYLAALFEYWRGDIIFRFKFICTKFHKGRVRISYDPVGDLQNTSDATQTTFTQIVDIGEDVDVTIRVPYLQAQSWCRTQKIDSNRNWYSTVGVTPQSHTDNYDNGLIRMQVVTPLSAPLASSQVPVLVFVSAADNFELAMPKDSMSNITTLPLQSTDEIVAGSATDVSPHLNLVTMGETFKSLRQLLHRTTYNNTVSIPANTTDESVLIRHFHSKFPLPYGYATDGVHSAVSTISTGNKPFNYTLNTPFNWLSPCYVGTRGSFVWNFNTDSSSYIGPIADVAVDRWNYGCTNADWIQTKVLLLTSQSSLNKDSRDFLQQGIGGKALTSQITQAGLSVVYPNYTNYKFQINNLQKYCNGSTDDGTSVEKFLYSTTLYPPIASTSKPIKNIQVKKYVACGPDFTFLYFLSTPTVRVLATPALS